MIRTNLLALTAAVVFLFAGCGKNETKTAENKAPETKTEQTKNETAGNTQVMDKNDKAVEFKCEGMTCGSCENKISKEVKKLSGVKEVIADSKTKTTKVIYAAGQVSEKDIENVINKAGFDTQSDVKKDTPVESKDKKSCGSKSCCKGS
jgi:copper chaperone CopZ